MADDLRPFRGVALGMELGALMYSVAFLVMFLAR